MKCISKKDQKKVKTITHGISLNEMLYPNLTKKSHTFIPESLLFSLCIPPIKSFGRLRSEIDVVFLNIRAYIEADAFGPLSFCNNGTNPHWQRWNPISIFLLNIFYIQTCVTTGLVCTCKRIFQTSACSRKPTNQCKHQQLCANFLSRGQFCCVGGLESALPRALSMRIGYGYI